MNLGTERRATKTVRVEVNICLPLNHRDAQEDRNIIEVVRKYPDKLTRFIYSQSYLLPSSMLGIR